MGTVAGILSGGGWGKSLFGVKTTAFGSEENIEVLPVEWVDMFHPISPPPACEGAQPCTPTGRPPPPFP